MSVPRGMWSPCISVLPSGMRIESSCSRCARRSGGPRSRSEREWSSANGDLPSVVTRAGVFVETLDHPEVAERFCRRDELFSLAVYRCGDVLDLQGIGVRAGSRNFGGLPVPLEVDAERL